MQQQYRTSCDRCQHAKVKCSQAKPTCQRCAKRKATCVYSPVKTIGRPRKRPAPDAASDDRALAPRLAREDAGSDIVNHPQLPSPDTTSTQSSVVDHPSDEPSHEFGHMALDAANINPAIPSGCPGLTAPLCPFASEPPRPPVTLFGSGQTATASCAEQWLAHCPTYQESPVTWNTSNTNLDVNCPWSSSNAVTEVTSDHDYDKGDSRANGDAGCPRGHLLQDSTLPASDCYVALLSQLTHVEIEMASRTPERPPPIDFILKTVNALRELKEQIFACRGHRTTDPLVSASAQSVACLNSSRPILLILSLLSERVIRLLEDLFRRATALSGSFTEELQVPSSADSRRMKRTMRSLIDYTSTCPFPEANQPLHVGAFEVSEEVKTKALRWILRKRIQGLLAIMNDMRTAADGSNNIGRAGASTYGVGFGKNKSIAGSIPGSENSVEDLHSRVETLLGRVDLTT